MSLTKTTSTQRLAAAKNMMSEGLSLEYCAGMFSLPVDELDAYTQAGLSVESSTDIPEINAPVKRGETTVICRPCPYPKGGHLSTGGVQSHSAGDIFPYSVVLVGDVDPTGHDYHLVGGGFKIGDCKWGSYNAAHNYATQLLDPLLME